MSLSRDAIIFGLGHFMSARSRLSFGGDGATIRITPRARAALNELLEAGYAEVAEPDDQIPGREFYRGTAQQPPLGRLAQAARIDVFGDEMRWLTFEHVGTEPVPCPTL